MNSQGPAFCSNVTLPMDRLSDTEQDTTSGTVSAPELPMHDSDSEVRQKLHLLGHVKTTAG